MALSLGSESAVMVLVIGLILAASNGSLDSLSSANLIRYVSATSDGDDDEEGFATGDETDDDDTSDETVEPPTDDIWSGVPNYCRDVFSQIPPECYPTTPSPTFPSDPLCEESSDQSLTVTNNPWCPPPQNNCYGPLGNIIPCDSPPPTFPDDPLCKESSGQSLTIMNPCPTLEVCYDQLGQIIACDPSTPTYPQTNPPR
jgi:hypothetical protein